MLALENLFSLRPNLYLFLLCPVQQGARPSLNSANGNEGRGLSFPLSLPQAVSPAAAAFPPRLQSLLENPWPYNSCYTPSLCAFSLRVTSLSPVQPVPFSESPCMKMSAVLLSWWDLG